MPQLDTLTYFSQFFWFIVIFLSFYVILSNDIIPNVATILKTRNKMIKSTPSALATNNSKIEIESLLLNNLKK